MPKLYHRFPRFCYLRNTTKGRRRRLQWALGVKPGDIVFTCSGFNQVVESISPDVWENPRRGWAIYNVQFNTVGGGGCSLVHCGVEPGWSREALEQRYAARYGHPGHLEWATEWFGVGEALDKHIAEFQENLDTLRRGGHILDERGVKI